jgi:N-acetylneuraminic acid mutarotase
MGIAAPGNHPGARTETSSWTDASGNLWLFGGEGNDVDGTRCTQGYGALACLLNDLWKYDPTTDMWTWMGGSIVIAQSGGYGTQGTPSAGNFPGARWGTVRWTDSSGKFWLFGGEGFDSMGTGGGNANLNDLWKYDPATNTWTWIGGSNLAGQVGAYGTKGTTAPGNIPGARELAVGWIDRSDNLWLFGGFAPWTAVSGKFNDLWKYQP